MIPMTLIDLSLPIRSNMPVYPGDSGVTITRAKASNENGVAVQVSTVLMGCHAGTHLDAPRHFIRDGATVADLPLDRFICPALVVACPWRPGEPLDIASLDLEAMQPGDALIVATGWDKRANSGEYYEQIPEFAPGTTERLLKLGIRLFGLDLPTVREAIHPGETGSLEQHSFMHVGLLGAGIIIVESLANILPLAVHRIDFQALPLFLAEDCEGSPVRACARLIG
jgi:arylformamidase